MEKSRMVSRRALLASPLLVPLAAGAASGSSAPVEPVTMPDLARAFAAYDGDARKLIQSSLATKDLYLGDIDGIWGPAMEEAFTEMMATQTYRDAAASWDWPLNVRIIETLFFVSSDAYLD